MSVVVYHQGKKIVKEHIYALLNITADSIEAQVLSLIEAKKNRLTDFASDGFIRSHLKKINERPDSAGLKTELRRHLVKNKAPLDKDIADIVIFNGKGMTVASTTADGKKRGNAGMGHYLAGKDGLSVGGAENLPDGRLFHVSAPITGHNGNGLLGVITVGFNAAAIDDILANATSGRHGTKAVFGDLDLIYIADSGKTIIASKDASLIGKKADTELLRRTLSEGKDVTAEFTGVFGDDMVGASTYVRETGWVVIASVSKKGIFAPVDNLSYAAFSLIAGGIIVVVAMTVLFAKKATTSIEEVAHFASRLTYGSLGERISIKGKKDEAAELGEALNAMAAKLQGSVDALIEREERLSVLNRFYSVLLKVNEAIIRQRETEELLNETCRICVDEGFFRFVWVGMVDPKTSSVKAAASCGAGRGFAGDLSVSDDDLPEGNGPAVTAVREGGRDVCNDIERYPRTGPWREEALKRGYRSSAAFPLKTDKGVVGAFVYYADAPGYFNEENIALLERMTGDISYAMEFMEKEALRKIAVDALRENERKYRTLVENIPQRIFLKDRNCVYMSCNSLYAADLKIRPEAIAGRTDYDFFPKELAERYRHGDNEVMASGHIAGAEENYAHGGKMFHMNAVRVPVKDETGGVAGVLGIFWDITPLKRSEEEKAKLEAQVRHMQKMDAIGRLTGGIAHDFNNLLMAIIGNTTLLKMRLPDDGKAMELAEQILATSERASRLTGGLLSFSRKHVMEIKTIELNGILRNVEKLLASMVGERIDVLVTVKDAEVIIKADAGQIEQVLVNLAANARDAMPEGGT